MLIQYIRNKKNQRIGIVVAVDKYKVGYSLCKTKNNKYPFIADKFDKQRGLEIAVGRANNVRDRWVDNMPTHIYSTVFVKMIARAERYFK